MFTKQIEAKGYEIIQQTEQSTLFKVSGKFFLVAECEGGFNIYRAIKEASGDYQLLVGKFGKSFRTVTSFVNARI